MSCGLRDVLSFETLDTPAVLVASSAFEQAAETTRFDLARHLPDPVTLPQLLAALEQAHERIGALLQGDGWWNER